MFKLRILAFPGIQPALTLLFFFLLAACGDSKETRIQRYLIQGNEMVRQQNFEQAALYYKEALKLDSCFADALNNLGSVYYRERNYDQAIAQYDRAITCRPNYTEAYMNRANTYYENNELFKALKDIDRVAVTKPDTLAVPFLRGLILTKLRNYDAAKESFRKALRIAPQNAELKVNLGTVYYYERRYDSARMFLTSVVSSDSPEPDAYNTLALIEIETGNLEKGMDWVTRALKLRPNDAYFLNNRGYIHLLAGNKEQALTDINQSITLDPYNGWAYRNKGIYYLNQGRAEDAIRMFSQAEGLDSYIEDIYYYMGQAQLASKNEQAACESFRKSAERKENRSANIPAKCK